MSWFDKIPGWMRGKAGESRAQAVPGPTPADQWTVPGIFLDSTGWQLSVSTPTSMTWTAQNATLVLAKDEVPQRAAATLTELRSRHRQDARAAGEDIVLVEIAETRLGHVLQTIYKRRDGLGDVRKRPDEEA